MREFEQMEMQFFVPPGSGPEHYAFWKEERLKVAPPSRARRR